MNTPHDILKSVFGYDSFRRGQEEIIREISAGHDALGIMPTGAGKSVCFQIPAILSHGVSIVLSPLISLMKDQVDALKQSGVRAESINSAMDWEDSISVLKRARRGRVSLLYVAPERLEMAGFRDFLSSLDVSMVVVDEAHCVSHWGHDFRPSYLSISPVVSSLPRRPVIAAFTATATPEVREDIIKQLGLDNPFVLTTGFDRENLFFQVEHPDDKTDYLLDYIKKFPDMSGIVYCSTRKAVESVCLELARGGVRAVRYHAGLDDGERFKNQEDFIYDRANVMVATNAFGMGIDKSNVRYVLHYNMPGSIDSYYQEAGRAGRDGAPADCILLFGRRDISTARFLISRGEDPESVNAGYRKLRAMIDYCHTGDCLRRHILGYFGENSYAGGCASCGNCNEVAGRTDVTVEAQKILSCVYRMAEKTGGKKYTGAMISDVLLGHAEDRRRGERIAELGFDGISTWGIMKEFSRGALMDILDFLIAGKLLQVDDTYGVISFTERSHPFLKEKTRLMMRQHKDRAPRRRKRETRASLASALEQNLFEALRKLRREIADSEEVPPYVVFSDKTLLAMCERKPSNRAEFLSVPGVGAAKLEKYGARFLAAIRNANLS
jgi:ATP-dependent DNA helicase RecQ